MTPMTSAENVMRSFTVYLSIIRHWVTACLRELVTQDTVHWWWGSWASLVNSVGPGRDTLHQVWSCPLTLLNWWWWRQEWKQTSLAHEWWSRLRSVRITVGQHDHHRHQHHLSLWHQSSTYLTSNNPSPRDFSKLYQILRFTARKYFDGGRRV